MVRMFPAAVIASLLALPVQAQSVEDLYGPGDMQGASNLMGEVKAIHGANIIRRGRVVPIGRALTPDMPLWPDQSFEISHSTRIKDGITTSQTWLGTQIGQVGTHMDGLGHMAATGETPGFYSGKSAADMMPPGAPRALGVEHLKPFFTRGIMIDMVTVNGGPMAAGQEITVENIETALDWHELAEPREGDVVIFHTGWGRHWIADNETYLSGAPGIGMEAANWLIERGVAVVGADTWSVELQDPEAETRSFPVHEALLPLRGIFLHQNLETERLIDAEIAEFAYIFAPLPVAGATGAAGMPLAVY